MITSLHYKPPGDGEPRMLLVMLPGAGIQAAEFAERGMVEAVHARGLAVDIIATQPELGHYLDGDIAAALHRNVIEPALARGYTRIWLLGISLGGMGALLYANAYPGLVEGLVLLAPFLGTQGTIAEVAKAGGLSAWSAKGSAAVATEQQALLWLQAFIAEPPAIPALYLGYGQSDRFAPGHRLLAAHLPDSRAITAAGGHDWETWLTLWQSLLNTSPFGAAP
jgi:pimeloyl-ACP methyl ester carboxylesterase